VVKTAGGSRTTGVSRSYGNNSLRGVKARFGLPSGSTAFSLDSRDGPVPEDCNTLVYAKHQGGGSGANPSINTYELGDVTNVKHGIRVDREVDISVRNKIQQPR
jgi:hypothetical protein